MSEMEKSLSPAPCVGWFLRSTISTLGMGRASTRSAWGLGLWGHLAMTVFPGMDARSALVRLGRQARSGLWARDRPFGGAVSQRGTQGPGDVGGAGLCVDADPTDAAATTAAVVAFCSVSAGVPVDGVSSTTGSAISTLIRSIVSTSASARSP